MVKERIIDWVKDTNVKDGFRPLPKNIIYYRDGVSDAQFLEVKNDELPQIERAFSDAMDELEKAGLINLPTKRPTVNITALVCIKRHSVRFYPVKPEDTDVNGNCKPGTHVQSVVTSPYFNDFYLQSHAAIKGTAKPAHYFVLRKDQDISIDDLRKLVSPSPSLTYGSHGLDTNTLYRHTSYAIPMSALPVAYRTHHRPTMVRNPFIQPR